jgi:hypothetical protein
MQSVGVFLSFGIITVAAMNAQAYLNDSPTEDPQVNLLKMLMFAQSPTRSGSQVRRHLGRAPSTRMDYLEDLTFKESWELLERARAYPDNINVGWESSATVDKIMESFGKLESVTDQALAYEQIVTQVQESFVLAQLEAWEPEEGMDTEVNSEELPKDMKEAIDEIAFDSTEILNMTIPKEISEMEPEFVLKEINNSTYIVNAKSYEEGKQPSWSEHFGVDESVGFEDVMAFLSGDDETSINLTKLEAQLDHLTKLQALDLLTVKLPM